MYEIEKNIHIPKDGRGRPRDRKYPFTSMEIGDSFFIPCSDKKEATKRANRVMSSARTSRKSIENKKFTTRAFDDGVRVWRIK